MSDKQTEDTSQTDDSFLWLEEVEDEKAIEWVKGWNEKAKTELEAHGDYDNILNDIKQILFAKDRVPFSNFEHGMFWNFWEDDVYKHGILRRTTLEEYKKESPQWEVKLDLDELSKIENENWVYKQREWFDLHSNKGLIYLSRGGKDASVVREFDFEKGEFVTDGFFVPEAKTFISALNEDELYIGSDFGEGSLTTSGYPRLVKHWTRGTTLSDAPTVFEAQETDVYAAANIFRDGDKKHIVYFRAMDFYHKEFFFAHPYNTTTTTQLLPIPSTASLLAIKEGKVYIQLKEDHEGIPSNTILRFALHNNSETVGPTTLTPSMVEILFTATKGQSIEDCTVHRDSVYITVLQEVRSRVLRLSPDTSPDTTTVGWKVEVLPFPPTGMITLAVRDEDDPMDITTMSYTDHLTPRSQYLVLDNTASTTDTEANAAPMTLQLLKQSPPRFDASAFEVHQYFATSQDGTQIPYFVLQRKDLEYTGNHPTILYGYGGFEISLTPSYSAVIGKVWLSRGGVYVIANIRGGGEFGPDWHQAALKTKRQVCYDDFAAVAEDLIHQKKITSPRHLGINGGSNGGLLMGVMMIQRPELFHAILCQVPLLDMIRFSGLLAGASWMGEYGNPQDPKKPDERAFLLRLSPYHNVQSVTEQQYPKVMFTTSTKDDRVHPGHARKMVAKMASLGHELLYYENINGGHAGSANLDEYAVMTSLGYTYLWQQLR